MKLRLLFGIFALSLGLCTFQLSTHRALADIGPCAACVKNGGGHGHGH